MKKIIKKLDEITIVKKDDKILLQVNKIKGKGLKFKLQPTSFLFLPLKEEEQKFSKAKNYSSAIDLNPIFDKREEEFLKETDKDKGSLSSYRIVCFDHDNERLAFINNQFNLEEKKKIIEGYYMKPDKIVKEVKTDFKEFKEREIEDDKTK